MPMQIYRSSDVGAPSIGRSLGSLITLLDACLVNGYGSKPAAGWSKAFTGTNKAVYRMGGGTQSYLRVDDTQNVDYCATPTNMVVGLAATSVDTILQKWTGGVTCYLNKPDLVASGGRWLVAANETTCYVFTSRAGYGGVYTGWGLLDLISYAVSPSTDKGKTMIIGNISPPATTALPPSNSEWFSYNTGASFAAANGHLLAGDTSGPSEPNGVSVGKTIPFSFLDLIHRGNASLFGSILVTPFYAGVAANILSASMELRGKLPALYWAYATSPYYLPKEGTILTYNQGAMAGKSLEVIYVFNNVPAAVPLHLEISNTWDTV